MPKSRPTLNYAKRTLRKLRRSGLSKSAIAPPAHRVSHLGAAYLTIPESRILTRKDDPDAIRDLSDQGDSARNATGHLAAVARACGTDAGELHAALQAAMGWDDSHLHEFRIGSQRFGKPDPSERWLGRLVTFSERTTRLSAVMGRVGAKAVYAYDFGDGWQHELAVEKVLVPEPGQPYPPASMADVRGHRKTAAASEASTIFSK